MGNNQLAVTGNALSPQALDQMSKGMQRQATREIERAVIEGLVVNTREQLRALLTNTAMQNAGALSELEGYLRKIAPSGTARYQHILDAYALGAAQTIARW